MRFGDAATALLALDRVSLQVAAGEFVCIVGPSGCGKTTLLRVLAGLQPAQSGSFTVQRDDSTRPLSAMVFQGAAVFPWMTVLDNVAYGLRNRQIAYVERNRIAREWIARMGLEHFSESYPHQLSGGMQQRVGLARAFAYNPEVLLMDEPFAALDAITRDAMHEQTERIWGERALTVVFVTHNVREAARLADRVVVMKPNPGRVGSESLITIPRPRTMEDPRVAEAAALLHHMLHTQEMPDD